MIDLTKKFIPTIGLVPVPNADGSPMVDPETGETAFARMHSPASKFWEVAMATRKRKNLKRVRENGGRIEAQVDDDQDKIDFLIAVTEEFIGLTVPMPDGETGAKALVRAIYSHPQLGFIRDGLDTKVQDWGSFLELSPSSSSSAPVSQPG